MKAYLVFLFTLFTGYSYAQDVQWAAEVIEYSSQFSGKDFSAAQATGPPNVLNLGGKDAEAWMASAPNNQEYLVFGFGTPVKARQIVIIESSNPGAIHMVYVYDENDDMHLVGSFIPGPVRVNNRILNIFLPTSDYMIKAVKLVIDGSKVRGSNSIDAVGVSNSVVPVRFGEGFAHRTNPRLSRKTINLMASGNESDIRPVYASDEKMLFFTRGYSEENVGGVNDPGDVWYSTYNEGEEMFSEPVRLSDQINNIGFNTSNSYYNYGNNPRLMVGNVSGSPKKVKANLTAISRKDGEWSDYEVQKINSAGQIPVDADYTITNNGNILIISSELRDSQGGTDLYVSFNEGENKWSEPVNLVSINTSEDEYAPFFSMEENALYFTSTGYNGLGGSDIYRVKRLDDSWNNWAQPENIGEDINTPLNDHYFYFDDQDAYAYLAQATEDGVMRIVRVERPRFIEANPLVVVKGKVIDEAESTPVSALLSLLVMPEEELYGVTFPVENSGNYQIFLRSGYKYKLVGEKEGYKPAEMSVTLENKNKPYTFDLNIFLSKDLAESQPELVTEVTALGAGIKESDVEEIDTEATEEDNISDFDDINIVSEEPVEEPDEVISEEPVEAVTREPEKEDRDPKSDYSGKPPEEKSYAADKVGTQSLVVFKFDSDVLLSQSYPILDAIAGFVRKHSDIKLEIGGFTDYIGDYYYNIDLSRRRASSVRKYLINQGIERRRTKIIGFGEKMPIVENMDSENIALNRRAEFNFTKY
jgi:outer membrane protein OmpA-like peptidoglycan-associated protein